MMKTRIAILCVFTALAAAALLVAQHEPGAQVVRQIVPGVWFRESDVPAHHSNDIIIEMKDYLIVVDANFPSGARTALADAKRVARKPVKYVFITHHHGDHIYGSAVWTAAGATTLAHQAVADEIKRVEPQRWQATAKRRKDVAELNRDAPEPPMKTFSEDLFVLNDGQRKVEFRFFGPAHTRGDGFVYLPKEQVLCTGDVVVNGPYNFTGDANMANWPNVIRAASKLKIRHVLTGHGPPAGREIMAGQQQYLEELYKAVKAGADQGKTPEQIRAELKLPDAVGHWVGEGIRHHIDDTYRQIKGTAQ
jgi:glyoxylase-like metal-dependent hydrolase (beta-lactamase superfamily II)